MINFNDIDVEKNFNATLLSVALTPRKIINFTEWITGADSLTQLKPSTLEASEVKIKFWIESKKGAALKRADVEKQISDITNLAMQCAINYSGFDFLLEGVLKSSNPKKITPTAAELELVFMCGSKISKVQSVINFDLFENEKEVINNGNQPSPAIISIIPGANMALITIKGLSDDPITVKNLKKDDLCIINGINGTVTVNGLNKLNDTDLWDFPHVKPGKSTITFENAGSATATVIFEERWV